MREIEIADAAADLPALVERVRGGEEVVLAVDGTPLAKIVPVEGCSKPRPLRRIGLLEGEFVVPEDFNRPLPDDLLDLFEGR